MPDPADVFLPGEAETLQTVAAELVVGHNITVPMLIEVMRYAAELRDSGIGLEHIRLAVDQWWWQVSSRKLEARGR